MPGAERSGEAIFTSSMHSVQDAGAQFCDVPREEARPKIKAPAGKGVAREEEAGPRRRWAAYTLLFSRCASELLLTLFRPVFCAGSNTFKVTRCTQGLPEGTLIHTIKGTKAENAWITVKVVETGKPMKIRTTELALVGDKMDALFSPQASKRPRLNLSPGDKHDYECSVCEEGGDLLMCDGESCPRVYHLKCLEPPLAKVPEGDWYCPECK